MWFQVTELRYRRYLWPDSKSHFPISISLKYLSPLQNFSFFFFPPLLQRQPFKIHTVRLPWQSPLTSAIVTVFPRIEFKLSNHLNNVFPLRIPWLGSHSSSKRLGFQWYKAGEPRTARCYIPTLLLFSQRLRLAALWQSTSEHPLPAIQAGICICISGNSHFRLTARISTGGASE